MRFLARLIEAGAVVALMSAPALASTHRHKIDAAANVTTAAQQHSCRGWGVHCEGEVTPSYCIADDKCAQALPGGMLLRYDQRMDALLGR